MSWAWKVVVAVGVALAPASFAQGTTFGERTLSPAAQTGWPERPLSTEPQITAEFRVGPRLFAGPDFAVVIPEIRDGALRFGLTEWADNVALPGVAPLGPPWWDPAAYPPGALIAVY